MDQMSLSLRARVVGWMAGFLLLLVCAPLVTSGVGDGDYRPADDKESTQTLPLHDPAHPACAKNIECSGGYSCYTFGGTLSNVSSFTTCACSSFYGFWNESNSCNSASNVTYGGAGFTAINAIILLFVFGWTVQVFWNRPLHGPNAQQLTYTNGKGMVLLVNGVMGAVSSFMIHVCYLLTALHVDEKFSMDRYLVPFLSSVYGVSLIMADLSLALTWLNVASSASSMKRHGAGSMKDIQLLSIGVGVLFCILYAVLAYLEYDVAATIVLTGSVFVLAAALLLGGAKLSRILAESEKVKSNRTAMSVASVSVQPRGAQRKTQSAKAASAKVTSAKAASSRVPDIPEEGRDDGLGTAKKTHTTRAKLPGSPHAAGRVVGEEAKAEGDGSTSPAAVSRKGSTTSVGTKGTRGRRRASSFSGASGAGGLKMSPRTLAQITAGEASKVGSDEAFKNLRNVPTLASTTVDPSVGPPARESLMIPATSSPTHIDVGGGGGHKVVPAPSPSNGGLGPAKRSWADSAKTSDLKILTNQSLNEFINAIGRAGGERKQEPSRRTLSERIWTMAVSLSVLHIPFIVGNVVFILYESDPHKGYYAWFAKLIGYHFILYYRALVIFNLTQNANMNSPVSRQHSQKPGQHSYRAPASPAAPNPPPNMQAHPAAPPIPPTSAHTGQTLMHSTALAANAKVVSAKVSSSRNVSTRSAGSVAMPPGSVEVAYDPFVGGGRP